ncbi:hypothetical protein [Hydrogenophaga sp.]|uniref:hypothetical protein n=1 Tax=Hydrogenophaga sp. TaxID=1904254 RepID=UPI00260A0C1F|nr:hypothetical protein [Hydrogenophaga sp.]MCW5655240.1 hypothetical protein [Hydrogenophaga sp.]
MSAHTRRSVSLGLAGALLALTGCGKDDPQARLEAAVHRLQDHVENRKTSAVMDMLHARFRAQGELDREWAQRTMTLLFLRYPNVKVVAITRNTRLDPDTPLTGTTEAQVLMTGAQGLIPERVEPYAITLRWRREGDDWKLIDLEWR